ncbi:histone-lysine N-methyltransferase SETMAR [Trichonephila clavipes]|nr:histone-lysine N-methyltransferase SETMAR [Trichonephila clavipes]
MALAVLHRLCDQIVRELRPVRAIVMARCPEKWFRTEMRSVIRFLWVKNVSSSDIPGQIGAVYRDEAIEQHVAKWCRSFAVGKLQVKNGNMEASGCSNSVTTGLNTARVEELVLGDRRVGLSEDWLDEGIKNTFPEQRSLQAEMTNLQPKTGPIARGQIITNMG